MKIETVPLEDLFNDPANVRRHSTENLDAIKASLHRFGQQKPIVVTPDGMIVAGNGTFEAAKAMGWDEIDVVRTSLEGSERTAFAIADNRTAELAEWDLEALRATIDMLEEEDVPAADVGWGKLALENLRRATSNDTDTEGSLATPDEGDVPDEAEEIDIDRMEFDHKCPRCGFEYTNTGVELGSSDGNKATEYHSEGAA